MNLETAVELEKAIAGLINDGIILVEHTQKMPATYIYVAMQQHLPPGYPYAQQPHMQHYGPSQTQQRPIGQPFGQESHYNQPHQQQFQPHQQMNAGPRSFFNQHHDVPVDLKVLLSRILGNVDTLYRTVAEQLDGIAYPEYESELTKLANRVLSLEEQLKGEDSPAEENNDAPKRNEPWVSTRHKFPNIVNLRMSADIDKLMEGLLFVLVPTPELDAFLHYMSERCTSASGDINGVSLARSVYSDIVSMPGIYKYDDTDQYVCISDLVDGNVYMMIYSPDSQMIYDAYTIYPEIEGRHELSRVSDVDTLSRVFFTEPEPTDATSVPGPYQNLMNLDGMQQRIVIMRRDIKTLTEPKKALRVVLEKIGNTDWSVPGTSMDISDDEMELLYHSNAVYSMPNHIRVVVILGDDKIVMASYDRRDYIIRDLYSISLNPKTGFNSIARSTVPDKDLLFLLTLGDKS